MALAGTFGYELDVTKLPEEDPGEIPGQVALYHKYHALIRSGDYYRIASYSQMIRLTAMRWWQRISRKR